VFFLNWGKERRLRRIFRKDDKTVIVPMDHGISTGPVKGLTNMQDIVDKLAKGGADAIIIHKGIAKTVNTKDLGLIIHLSGSTKLSQKPNLKVQVCSIEEAIKLGADAVSIHVNVGCEEESQMLMDMGMIVDECDHYGLPLLAMMYPRGPNIKNEHAPELINHVARLGAELGADVIKTNYTGSIDTFREIISCCPVPVVIAGGPKAKTDKEVLQMVFDSIKAGGSGLSVGRNVFQHENPISMSKALSAIVHDKASVEDAMGILEGK
jgi:fructose-bisphosphate aldolase/2-amino-3,7-dideoxy-D-threo-hept-6-ulosonate synthase